MRVTILNNTLPFITKPKRTKTKNKGTLVPVDPKAMFLSTLQLVLVPVLAGAALNQLFPTVRLALLLFGVVVIMYVLRGRFYNVFARARRASGREGGTNQGADPPLVLPSLHRPINKIENKAVARARAYTPFLATVIVVLIVGSMIASNVPVVLASGEGAALCVNPFGHFLMCCVFAFFYHVTHLFSPPSTRPFDQHLSITQTTTQKTHQTKTGFQIISAVFVLHSSGFFLGYTISKALGLPERICRTNSIEVGMQSSALAAVLAKVHFRE